MSARESFRRTTENAPPAPLASEGGGECGSGVARDSRGAVYLEFLIAFFPFLVFFLCLWQISILFYAKLMVEHAAFSAARAAAVVVAECPSLVGDAGPGSVNHMTDARKDRVEAAALIALSPLVLDGTIGLNEPFITFPTVPAQVVVPIKTGQAYAPMSTSLADIRVRINTMFICKIGLASAIICDGLVSKVSGGLVPFSRPLVAEGVFPFQGASYTYDPTCE